MERFAAFIKALTGREPKVCRIKDGTVIIKCYGEHLEGFMRYIELADAVVSGWRRRAGDRPPTRLNSFSVDVAR